MKSHNRFCGSLEVGPCSRREFVRAATLGAAALAASPLRSGEPPGTLPGSARVFAVHSKDVCPEAEEYQPADSDVVKAMVREAILRMGIGNDVGEVVRGWCPSGKTPATARVKVKYCGLMGRFPAHVGVVNGVVRLLIDEGGVEPKNIHVYERNGINFGEANRRPLFGTPFADTKNREKNVVYSHLGARDRSDMANADYKQEIRLDIGSGRFKEYTIHFWDGLDKDTDILINIPVLKRHMGIFGLPATTIAMKNHFGSIRSPQKLHGSDIGRKIAAVNMAEPIRKKQRLIVVDSLYVMYTGGPQLGKMKYGVNKLLVAQDPVAVDYVGWGMINAIAEEAHKATSEKYYPLREPKEIAIAAQNQVGYRAARWQDHVADIELAT